MLNAETDVEFLRRISAARDQSVFTEFDRLIALARRGAAIPDAVVVMERAVRLSQEHSDFKLYAMEPFHNAIAALKEPDNG